MTGLQYLAMLSGSASMTKGLTAAERSRARAIPVTLSFCLDANGLPLEAIETMRSPSLSMVITMEWSNWGTPMNLQAPLHSRVVDSTTVTSA